VHAHRACHADEGTEPGTARPGEPFLQTLLGEAGLLVPEQMSESLLQEIGSVERAIRSLNLADLGPVRDGQDPLAAEQGEASALDRPLALRVLLVANQLAAHCIDRIGGQALNVAA